MILDLLLDHISYLKIGVVVAQDWPKWETILTYLYCQVLQIHLPERLRKFFQVETLSVAEWLPPNQASRLNNLQYN